MNPSLGIYPLEQLYKQPLLPIPYVVNGLLAPGLYILGGSPKVGKSWMAFQLCLAVSRGVPFLGRTTRQSDVLYLALEDGTQRLHARAVRLSQTAPSGIYLCSEAPCVGQGLEESLRAAVADNPKIRLVIIDTLQKVRAPQQYGTTYGGDYQDIAALKALADEMQICLLVIHHLRKMGDTDPMNRLSGTNGLSGAADGMLILAREKRQEGLATLTATGRDIEDAEEQLQFLDCRWYPVTAENRLEMDLILSPLQALLREKGEFSGTATELAAMLGQNGQTVAPAALSKYIQTHAEWLAQAGIQVETRRTNQKRNLFLKQCSGVRCDGGDSSDSVCGDGMAPAAPSQPSLLSQMSQAS